MMEADGEALHGHAFLHRCLTPVLLYEKSNPFSSLISIGFLILAKQLCNGTPHTGVDCSWFVAWQQSQPLTVAGLHLTC